jgi:hypothetical protein
MQWWQVPKAPSFYMIGCAELGAGREVEPNFHFSEAPAVTAGFIGFSFDIRK